MIKDIDDILLNTIAWAKEAGKIQLNYFRGKNLEITAKLNESDVVTIADKASEKVIIDAIHATYPQHSILSEESGEENLNGDYTWVIDPLDGTTNFSEGLPQFCVSIGLKYNGETILGVVFAPYLNELYTAVKGEGAYMNGLPITVGIKTDINQAVVSTGFPVDKATTRDNNLDNLENVLPHVRGMRRMGAAAVDICYVAAGYLDGYWELNLHEWDVCAAELIASEAGAMIVHFRKDRNISTLVASPAIGEIILPLLSTTPRL
ncbi:MAG: inositol monophosphatase family protein [Muribaculaceae bacterium]